MHGQWYARHPEPGPCVLNTQLSGTMDDVEPCIQPPAGLIQGWGVGGDCKNGAVVSSVLGVTAV